MYKILCSTAVLALISLSNLSYAKKVKFSVDMGTDTVSSLGAFVKGDFQDEAGFPADWMDGTTALTQEGTTTIWSTVVDIPAFRTYQYIYLFGPNDYEAEFVPQESHSGFQGLAWRFIYIDSTANDTTDIGAIRLNANAPVGKKLLRYNVEGASVGFFGNSAFVQSSVPWGDHYSNRMGTFDNKVFIHFQFLDTSVTSVNYKYVNGTTVEQVPIVCAFNSNRVVSTPNDVFIDTVCFASCIACIPVAIETFNDLDFSIQPNPVSDILSINGVDKIIDKAVVYNAVGQQMNISFKENNVSVGSLSEGLYFLHIFADNKVKVVKFYKNR